MILPVVAYGHPILKKEASDIDDSYEDLDQLIDNMWETMYNAKGVGLAAPQIGKSIRLFVIDTIQVMEEEAIKEGIKKVFINAEKIEEQGELWSYEEGCLSIPNIRADVERPTTITLRYLDENFEEHQVSYSGVNARVIQHEYDHIDGKLFLDHVKPVRKRLIKRKLEAIRKGAIDTDYKMAFFRR